MASRLRHGIGTRINFFFFQDIITDVTGILILVTLIMSLYLDQPDPMTERQESQRNNLSKLLDELAAAERQYEQKESSAAELAAVPDASALKTEIESWRRQITVQTNRLARLQETLAIQQEQQTKRAELLGVAELKRQSEQTEQLLSQQKSTNSLLSSEVRELEEVKRAVTERADQAAAQHQLWLLPDTAAANARQPILVTLSNTNVAWEKYNQPATRKSIPTAAGERAFAEKLREWQPSREYIVFYLRPSAISRFHSYLQAAKDAGFQVGYDALEENQQVQFSAPPAR